MGAGAAGSRHVLPAVEARALTPGNFSRLRKMNILLSSAFFWFQPFNNPNRNSLKRAGLNTQMKQILQ